MRAIAVVYPLEVGRFEYGQIKQYLDECYQRYRTRKQLARLSAEQLRDVGITSEQASAEAAKPFWVK